MITLLLAIVFCMPPVPEIVLEDRVDVLEVNHVAFENGGYINQLIGWDFSEDRQRYDVVFWWHLSADSIPRAIDGVYVSEDTTGRITRRIIAPVRWERWLPYDIERQEHYEILPSSQRRELSKLRETTPSASDLVTP